jgi:16S rRNA (uracil1498-N3)-methyltransferase
MHRFHLPPGCWASGELTGDEARHLSQVLRIRAGETIIVFDGHGRRAAAEVVDVSRDHAVLRIGEAAWLHPPAPAITLAQAVPKGKNMDLIVRKAVELGVSAIQPLVTRNTVVQPGDGKPDKWRRAALEACKQCGQDTLPRIGGAMDFAEWLAAAAGEPGLKLIASLAPGAGPLREVLRAHPGTAAVTLLIGPEGDFTAEEIRQALDAGFLPVSLGAIVLRVETAALFCLSALRYEFSA